MDTTNEKFHSGRFFAAAVTRLADAGSVAANN
jgi:hypothetical protein